MQREDKFVTAFFDGVSIAFVYEPAPFEFGEIKLPLPQALDCRRRGSLPAAIVVFLNEKSLRPV